MKKLGWRGLPLLMFAILIIFLWRGLSLDPHHLPSARLGKALPEFSLPDLQHPEQQWSSKAFKNKVVLLNVWASWCAACTEEQVFLLQLAKDGVLIYGLNYQDQREDALRWLAQWGNPYQEIAQDKDGKAAIDLGVYGAPETFVIDKKGTIRLRHVGVLTAKAWQQEVEPLMQKLQGEAG